MSEATQATTVTKAIALFRSYDWAGPMMWYAARDQGTTTDTRENFYGVVRRDFSPKPAFAAYRAAATAG